jgi:hypothetical protein
MATCPKTETCHPEGIDVDFPGISARGVEQAVEKRHSAMINQMVSSSFRYVSGKGYVFSRHTASTVGRAT